jgi:hypothetical protein
VLATMVALMVFELVSCSSVRGRGAVTILGCSAGVVYWVIGIGFFSVTVTQVIPLAMSVESLCVIVAWLVGFLLSILWVSLEMGQYEESKDTCSAGGSGVNMCDFCKLT